VWLVTRTHPGTPALAAPPPAATKLSQVHLCDTCAHGYNPEGNPTDEHPDAGLAIDGDPTTYWETQDYYSDTLYPKSGVGLFVDAKPGTTAREIEIITQTPGWNSQIYATNAAPVFAPQGAPGHGGTWTLVGSANNVKAKQTVKLTSGTTQYRYWLVWITSLAGREQIELNEVALYR
jgi:hypothetical protein